MKNITFGIIGLLAIGTIIALVLMWQKSSQSNTASLEETNKSAEPQIGGNMQLQKIDITEGNGIEAVPGKEVTVNYAGTLENGIEFDSSYSRNQPFTFTLGAGQVIKGWDQGVAGMKVGGKRKLIIPADLAYGAQSPSPKIPANSTLVFEIELLDVK